MSVPSPEPAELRRGEAVTEYLGMVARHTPWRGQPNRRSIRFDEFRQVVRRFRPSELLPSLAAAAVAVGEPPFSMSLLKSVSPWAIALAARESILWGNEHRREEVTAEDLRLVFNAHNNIYEDKDHRAPSGLLPTLTRVVYEQFPYQESVFEEISRSHALLVDGVDEIEAEVLSEAAWVELLGAPLGQAVGATIFLHVAAMMNAGWFDPTWLDREDLQAVYDSWPRRVIEQRAQDLSSSFAQFKAAYNEVPHPPPGFERYAYNPLNARPFVRMSDGRLLAPQPRLILRTISPGGLYYPGIKAFDKPFARDLGKLTERYAGRLLAAIDEHVELHAEVIYGKPEMKSIDWFLVLPSAVVMFEVKSARFGLLDRAAVEGFDDRAKKLLGKAAGQLVRSAEALDERNPAFAHIPSDRPRIGIIVTGEPFYLANSPWMRDLIQSPPFPTLTASLRDIELLASLPIDEVERQLIEITNDADRSTWSLGSAIRRVSGRGRNRVLQEAWDSYPWLDTFLDVEDG